MVFGACGQGGGAHQIGDLHQFVRIGARINIGADRGRHGINVGRAVTIDLAGDIAAAAGGRLE